MPWEDHCAAVLMALLDGGLTLPEINQKVGFDASEKLYWMDEAGSCYDDPVIQPVGGYRAGNPVRWLLTERGRREAEEERKVRVQVTKGRKPAAVPKYQVQVRRKYGVQMDPHWYPASGWCKKPESATTIYNTLMEQAMKHGTWNVTYFLQIVSRFPDGSLSASSSTGYFKVDDLSYPLKR